MTWDYLCAFGIVGRVRIFDHTVNITPQLRYCQVPCVIVYMTFGVVLYDIRPLRFALASLTM